MVKEYILIGCGGFALEVAEYIKNLDARHGAAGPRCVVSDVVSDAPSRFEDLCTVLGYRPAFHTSPEAVTAPSEKQVLICLGAPEDRQRNFLHLQGLGFQFGTLIDDTAWIAESAQIGEGAIIAPFAFIGVMSRLGANCVVNARATVGHDVQVGQSSVLSPHSDMNGASSCGRVSMIGAGAILDPKAAIGDYTKVASGAVIKQQFGDGFLLVGNPAKGRQMFKVGTADTA